MSLAIAAAVFPIIFLGELPDKTMFASVVMATRGKGRSVWLGSATAFLLHVVIATTAPSPHNDLNDWWRADPDGLTEKLEDTLQPALHRAPGCSVPTPAL